MVDLVGLEQQEAIRPVRCLDLFGEEMRVARRDNGLDGEQACFSMIGVESVPLPGIVTEHRVGPHPANDLAHLSPLNCPGDQLAVDLAEEMNVDGPERGGGVSLLRLTRRHEVGLIGAGVPRTLRPVGEDEQVDRTAGSSPLGQGPAAAELDVVGVRADRECPGGNDHHSGEIDAPRRVRSSAMSTSKARVGSRSTRTARPRSRASAAWRRNDPAP